MALIIGIDVGGTHADGVLLSGDTVLKKNKVQVDQDNLSDSIITLLKTLVPEDPQQLDRIHLSTTLCTNALVNDELDTVGMFIQAGPGMNPDFLNCGDHVCFLDGAIDHRGHVIKSPSSDLIDNAAAQFVENGVTSIGVVTKFSHRNNNHEESVKTRLEEKFPHISVGHRLSGLPNFPRRVYSTWLNAALKTRFMEFKDAMEEGLKQLSLDCPCYILKADGGTIPFDAAGDSPCESVHSGPSASVMGCLALQHGKQDAVLLDIGGTTTDIAIMAEGTPLLEPYGITIKGRPTLIRALNTRSIGLGGDSAVTKDEQGYRIGPKKSGPPMSLGGTIPTPTDAMVVLGSLEAGSKDDACRAMRLLVPDQEPEQTAVELLDEFCNRVKEAVEKMIEEVFSRPVYTVAALLDRKRIEPREIITVGGPAKAMQKKLAEAFSLPCTVPEHFEVANAVGSGRTRPTLQATLYADTSDGTLSIPEAGIREQLGRSFSMGDAEERLMQTITQMGEAFGIHQVPAIDFTERQEMNTVRGFSSSGKIISLKAQIRPGLDNL